MNLNGVGTSVYVLKETSSSSADVAVVTRVDDAAVRAQLSGFDGFERVRVNQDRARYTNTVGAGDFHVRVYDGGQGADVLRAARNQTPGVFAIETNQGVHAPAMVRVLRAPEMHNATSGSPLGEGRVVVEGHRNSSWADRVVVLARNNDAELRQSLGGDFNGLERWKLEVSGGPERELGYTNSVAANPWVAPDDIHAVVLEGADAALAATAAYNGQSILDVDTNEGHADLDGNAVSVHTAQRD